MHYKGVSYEVIADAEYIRIREEINNPEINQEVMKLEKALELLSTHRNLMKRGADSTLG